jgi:hypothetical protein
MVAAVGLTIAAACERDAAPRTEESTQGIATPEYAPAPPAPAQPGTGAIGESFGTGGGTGTGGVTGDVSGVRASRGRAGTPGSRVETQDPSAVDRVDAAGAQGTGTSVVPSMLIRTGNAMVEVDSLEIAVAELRLLATRVGGYVANTSMQTGAEEMRSASLELKIPAARFDEAVRGLTPLGKVEGVNITTEDVGEEFVDVTARVANANRLEDRLVTLLATRTGRLEDVLQVERELARVREEIERYEGRLRYLRTRAAVSTLVVTVHEPRPIVGPYAGANPIGDAFRAMWRNLVTFVAGLIAALGWLIPLALILAGAWWVLRRVGFFDRRNDGVRLPRTARVPRGTVARTPAEQVARDAEEDE